MFCTEELKQLEKLEKQITTCFNKNNILKLELTKVLNEANHTFKGLVNTGNDSKISAKITLQTMEKLITLNKN